MNRSGRLLALPLLLGLSLVADQARGQDLPDVVRVQVPSDRVPSFFPEGTPLRGMPRVEFEALLAKARAAVDRRETARAPRLIRAVHRLRWDDGELSGRSEFVVEGNGAEAFLALEPWNAWVDAEGSTAAVRTLPDGRTALRVEADGQRQVEIAWRLRSQPASQGRGFELALPELELSALELDLPATLAPEDLPGLAADPAFAAATDRRRWRCEGVSGRFTLRLREAEPVEGVDPNSTVWLDGPVRVEVGDAEANWEADWRIDLGPKAPRELTVELDPELELVGVTGPDLAGFESSRAVADGPNRLTVHFSGSARDSTRLLIEAVAKVPGEGRWRVPAARPLDGVWTGGRTSVWVGPARVVERVEPRAGRRVPARPEERDLTSRGGRLIVFEAEEPASAADLTFRSPRMEAVAEIRGVLELGDDSPRLQARVAWSIEQGPVLDLPIALPPDWTPQSVQIEGLAEPTSWREERRPEGGTRVVVQPPTYLDFEAPVVVALTAIAPGGRGGAVTVPRVRVEGARLADDLWLALTTTGAGLEPVRARGLSWIDPAILRALAPPADPARQVRDSLAWRWVEEDGEAVFAITRPTRPVVGETWVVARIRDQRLTVDWFAVLEATDSRARAVTLLVNEPLATLPDLKMVGREIGPALEARPAPEQAEPGGSAWVVELPPQRPADRRQVLHARLERSWTESGSLPLLSLAERSHAGGTALVWVDDDRQLDARALGLYSTDRASAERGFARMYEAAAGSVPELEPGRRLARAFTFGPSPGRLELQTSALAMGSAEGVVTEARLSVRPGRDGEALQRLTLQVLPGAQNRLKIRLPDGAVLERSLLNGKALVPLRLDDGLIVPLAGVKSGRPTCEVALDYAIPRLGSQTDLPNLVRWPELSIPCLASTCEFELPPGFEVAEAGTNLVRTGVNPERFPLQGWDGLSISDRRNADLENAIRDLEVERHPVESGGATLGEWLTRLDAGTRPIVVDRLALASAGFGPRSRPPALASEPGGVGALVRTLRALGLRLVPLGEPVMITTAAGLSEVDRRDPRGSWAALLRGAIATGSDPTDRYQTVARWLGEPTPEAPPSSDAPGTGASGTSSRWVGLGPAADGLGFEPGRFGAGTPATLAAGLIVLLLLVSIRSAPATVRGLAAGLALATALLAIGFGGPRLAPTAIGVILGTLGGLGYWQGLAMRRSRGAVASAPAALLVLISVVLICRPIAASIQDRADTMLVLFPYEGVPNPAAPPDRVVMKLNDFERLTKIADHADQAPNRPLTTVSVRHEIQREGKSNWAIVKSRYQLEAPDETLRLWSFPLGEGRETTCKLDDHDAPLKIAADGRTASVAVEAAGVHHVEIRRRVPLDPSERLRLPVVPVATASVWVSSEPGLEIPDALGPQDDRKGLIEGRLGPSESLVVDWSPRSGEPQELDSIEGLLLWDVEPAGDRVRARLTVRGEGQSCWLRLALEPGLRVRSATFPGWADATWEGTADRPVWTARIVPAPAEGMVVGVEFWRPRPDGEPTPAQTRPAPRIVPLEAEAWSGIVAVRSATSSKVRLDPVPGESPILEELFLRGWGPLTGSSTPVVGAVNWRSAEPLHAVLDSATPPPTITPTTQLELGPGRIDVRVEARCLAPEGRLEAMEVGVPEGMNVTRVNAPGLLGWERIERGRLRLRFEESSAVARSLTIQGWIGLPGDPLSAEATTRERALPQMSWPGSKVEPGMLVLVAPPSMPFRIEEPQGLAATRPPAPDETGAIRASYRVTTAEPSGMVRWLSEPPRASVSIWSHLTLDPGSVEWTARLRCQVVGGPFRDLRLELPASWAERVHVEAESGDLKSSLVREGNKLILQIRPDRPIWGTRDLLLRGSKPIEGRIIDFPNLVPLGNGQVTSYMLAWSDRSGRAPVAEGSAGIHQVDAERFELAGLPVPRMVERKLYQVLQGSWSLRLRLAGEHESSTHDESSRPVAWSETECMLDAKGHVVGRSRLGLATGRAPFLVMTLPKVIVPLAVLVDGVSIRPLRSPDGSLLVAIGDVSNSVVTLLWDGRVEGSTLALPRPPTLNGGSLVAIFAPPGSQIESPAAGIEPTSLADLEVERLERLGASLQDQALRLDRSSARDRAGLVAELVRFEVRRRSADRNLQSTARATTGPPPGSRQSLPDRLSQTTKSLSNTLRDAGLGDLQRTAKVQAGSSDVNQEPIATDLGLLSEPYAEVRLRRLGVPWTFRGQVKPGDDAMPFRWNLTKVSKPGRAEGWVWFAAAIGALALGFWLPRLKDWPFTRAAVMAALLAALVLALGLWLPGLVVGIVMLLVGRSRTDLALNHA